MIHTVRIKDGRAYRGGCIPYVWLDPIAIRMVFEMGHTVCLTTVSYNQKLDEVVI